MKTLLKKRFKEVYPKKARLLAIHLNGFSHSVFYDGGTKKSDVIREEFSHCMPEGNWSANVSHLFKDVGNSGYQNNAKEIIYVLPEDR